MSQSESLVREVGRARRFASHLKIGLRLLVVVAGLAVVRTWWHHPDQAARSPPMLERAALGTAPNTAAALTPACTEPRIAGGSAVGRHLRDAVHACGQRYAYDRALVRVLATVTPRGHITEVRASIERNVSPLLRDSIEQAEDDATSSCIERLYRATTFVPAASQCALAHNWVLRSEY